MTKTTNIAFTVFVAIIAAVGAYVTFVIWTLGVGIDSGIHNAIGAAFVSINVGCWIAMAFFLRKGRKSLALVVSLAPAPLSILLVYVVAQV